ncbi:MAG: endonuclease/exonuclease/phosphatase family protein [Pseudomonadota bacterium]
MHDAREIDPVVRRPRGLVWFSLLVSLFGTTGLFLLVIASYYGHLWTPLDAFSHLRVHLIGATLGLGIAALSLMTVQRVRIAVLVLVVAAVFTVLYAGLWPILSQSRDPQPAAGPNEREFKLVSFNSWTGHKNPKQIADYLATEDADVVVLVEFPKEFQKILGLLRQQFPHQYDCNETAAYCHIAVLSRHPFAEVEAKSDWKGPPMVRAQFGKELGGLTVFGVHFSQPFTPNWQWSQMRAMASETFVAKGPFIVAGDFNATKDSFLVNAFQEFSGSLRITSLPTWPTWFFELPQIGIDHMFISNGVRPLSPPKVRPNAGSDHLPIKAHLAVRTVP